MANIAYRLTIQFELSGFSFKITDPSGGELQSGERSFPSDVSCMADLEPVLKKELASISALGKKYNDVRVYVSTPIYTLVPTALFVKEDAKKILSQIHKVDDMDEVLSIELPEHEATLIYSIPNSISSRIFKIQKGARYYPTIYALLKSLPKIEENNKVAIHISNNDLHIVAAEREKLLLANSYPIKGNFTNAQYYIFMVIKEMMFNPEFTILQNFGSMEKNGIKHLKKYFKGINNIPII